MSAGMQDLVWLRGCWSYVVVVVEYPSVMSRDVKIQSTAYPSVMSCDVKSLSTALN